LHFFEQFETAPAGVLDDGIPALRMYVKQDDRIGLSIPTTANSKAIIKQVKRALQVALQQKTCAPMLLLLPPPIAVHF
jgi:hypothetical protein